MYQTTNLYNSNSDSSKNLLESFLIWDFGLKIKINDVSKTCQWFYNRVNIMFDTQG